MKMTPQRRALDKIYRRRDRYEIPEWQRGVAHFEARLNARRGRFQQIPGQIRPCS